MGVRMADFAQAANAQSLVCVLEHEAALANIDAILAVEGIDVFFIGPSDLSQSMGHPGNPNAPPVAKAIKVALARILAAGRTPGIARHFRQPWRRGGRRVQIHLYAPAPAPEHRRCRLFRRGLKTLA
jgi:4-hydroxy-2-oxoheptanedioate aldolase